MKTHIGGKMKNFFMTILIVGTVGTAQAQSEFEGFYAQAGIGYEKVSPLFSGGTVLGNNYSATGKNPEGFAGAIGVGYNFALTSNFLLGIGAEYSPIQGKSDYTATISTFAGELSVTKEYLKKDLFNIFVSPSLLIEKNKLIYAKIGYTGANISTEGRTLLMNGYSLGLGYKQIISGGWYGFGEANYTKYGNTSLNKTKVGDTYVNTTGSFKATGMNVLVGLGYRF
jgi:outer membrane immunogenic protein